VFNACLGDSVSFVNSTTISKGTITYRWDLGNGSTSTKTNVKQKYINAGSYKVTLTATSMVAVNH
jgi:PKD repeat protein